MERERFALVKDIYLAALELDSGARASFLKRRCGDDAELRREVEQLFAQATQPSLMTGGLGQYYADAMEGIGVTAALPRTIGPYEIISLLGRGGMGVVYRAVQREPIEREVAVKLIPFGLDSDAIVARFEAERQTLARMDHPHIAKVLTAGTTADQSPYFVMELVDGTPITHFCRERRLGPNACLELFVAVCRAVQHAHQKGVIHRDLKPSNILVVEVDGAGVPKIIDFGVAKLLDDGENTLTRTLTGEVLGTLDYMSPEQARGTSHTLDTRSDVYALGVVLFEILTGELPHDLRGHPAHEAVRAIAENPPRRLRETTQGRKLDVDLETIVAKALQTDAQQRYASAAALADDLERVLASEPIQARSPSTIYQVRKLIQRHRWPFAFAVSLFLLVTGFAVVSVIQLQEQRRQRSRAEAESFRAQQINSFLQEMLAAARPGELGHEAKVKDVLDRAAENVDAELKGQPRALAAAHATIADTYRSLALHGPARRHYERALELSRALTGEHDADVAQNLFGLAETLYRMGDMENAELRIRESIAIQRGLPDDATLSRSLSLLGRVIGPQGRIEEAEQLFREGRDLYARQYGRDDLNYANLCNNLAHNLSNQGRLVEAETLFRETLALQQHLIEGDHPSISNTLWELGKVLGNMGKGEEGETMLRSSIAMAKRIYGEPNLRYTTPLQELALLLIGQHRLREAEEVAREALEIQQQQLPPRSVRIGIGHRLLARIAFEQDDLDTAEASCRRAIEVFDTPEGPRPISLAEAMHLLGRIHVKQGRWALADSAFAHAHAGLESTLGTDHPSTAQVLASRGELRLLQGRTAEAESDLITAIGRLGTTYPPGHPEVLQAHANLGRCLARGGRFEEAESQLLGAIAAARAAESVDKAALRDVLRALTSLYAQWNREEEARRWTAELASLEG